MGKFSGDASGKPGSASPQRNSRTHDHTNHNGGSSMSKIAFDKFGSNAAQRRMPRRLGLRLVAGSVLLVAAAAQAQDVVQVAGDSHSVLIDNAQVRVLSVTIRPGQKAPMHSHPANVSYVISGARLRITTPDGKNVEKEPKTGTTTWSEATTHEVENIGTTELKQVQIELKNPAPAR
jgi:quercetin dioxygenase-like cupin family protein